MSENQDDVQAVENFNRTRVTTHAVAEILRFQQHLGYQRSRWTNPGS